MTLGLLAASSPATNITDLTPWNTGSAMLPKPVVFSVLNTKAPLAQPCTFSPAEMLWPISRPSPIGAHRQRVGRVEDDLAGHIAHRADRRFGRRPRRRQHDHLAERGGLGGAAGARLAADLADERLRLIGLGIADAEADFVTGFLRPGGAERAADIAGADDGKFHGAILLAIACCDARPASYLLR